jgi:predicted nucleotidyltransferase
MRRRSWLVGIDERTGSHAAPYTRPVAPHIDLDLDSDRLDAICRRYGIARLDVFGSVSRGEAGPGSDIDLLYELVPGTRLGWEIETLTDELSEVMGRPVDLVARVALHQRLRAAVLADAQLIYAA